MMHVEFEPAEFSERLWLMMMNSSLNEPECNAIVFRPHSFRIKYNFYSVYVFIYPFKYQTEKKKKTWNLSSTESHKWARPHFLSIALMSCQVFILSQNNAQCIPVQVSMHSVCRSACFWQRLLPLKGAGGGPASAPSSPPPPSLSFFLYVKRLQHPRCWTVSNRFVCEGEASHSEYHNAILSLLVTLRPHPEHLYGSTSDAERLFCWDKE